MPHFQNHTRLTIDAASFIKAGLVFLAFVLLYILRDLALVLLTSVVIASAIEPIALWFIRYKIPRVFAVIFIYLAFAVFVIGLFYFFLPPLLEETSGVLSLLPQYLESNGVVDVASGSDFLSNNLITQRFSDIIPIKDAIDEIRVITADLSRGVFQSVRSVFGDIVSFILIIVISFYLAVQEKGIENFLRLITPLRQEKYVINLWQRSQAKIGLWMQGQLLLGLIVGVLVFLGLTILGVPYAFLLAVLAAVFELIPLFGPILASIPAVALGFIDSYSLGLLVIGLYLIIQQFENHLIYPLVVRKVVGVSPILVIISLIVGAKIAGFLGLLLAVPVAAALMEFANDFQLQKIKEEKELEEEEKKQSRKSD